MPKMLHMLMRYKACRISEKELFIAAQKYAKKLFVYADDKRIISEFWDKNQHKIKKFYLKKHKDDDVILSASGGFLIREMCERLGIKTVIASEADTKTGEILQVCFRERKPEIFKKHFPDAQIDEFYTDSMNDEAMFKLAKRVYLVKGEKIKEII